MTAISTVATRIVGVPWAVLSNVINLTLEYDTQPVHAFRTNLNLNCTPSVSGDPAPDSVDPQT